MALYTILFGVSIFLIALVSAIIKKMFFHWKEEHKIERMIVPKNEEHPTISIIIICDKCVIRRRTFAENLTICDVISRSDMSITKEEDSPESQATDNVDLAALLSPARLEQDDRDAVTRTAYSAGSRDTAL